MNLFHRRNEEDVKENGSLCKFLFLSYLFFLQKIFREMNTCVVIFAQFFFKFGAKIHIEKGKEVNTIKYEPEFYESILSIVSNFLNVLLKQQNDSNY